MSSNQLIVIPFLNQQLQPKESEDVKLDFSVYSHTSAFKLRRPETRFALHSNKWFYSFLRCHTQNYKLPKLL